MARRVRVVVVGGGPSGLVAALACRARGLEVRLLEAGGAGRDKPCGEGLMPDALEVLGRLGVDLADRGRPFRGIRYLDRSSEAVGTFPGRPGLGVRRTVLHRALWRAAEAAGVEIERGRVEALERRSTSRDAGRPEWGVRFDRRVLEADVVLGADGLRSRCRRDSGLDRPVRSRRLRYGVRRHFEIAPWSDRVDVHWDDGVEAYVTPVAGNLVGVALLWTDPPIAGSRASDGKPVFEHLLRRFPRLEAHLAGATPASAAAGCGPLEQRARGAVSGNLALVGDAAGYVDAITGEGMAVAFAQAEPLADAIVTGDLDGYERARRRIVRRPERMTRLALLLSRHPALRRRVLRAFAGDPLLFDRVLALHVGAPGASQTRVAAAVLARVL